MVPIEGISFICIDSPVRRLEAARLAERCRIRRKAHPSRGELDGVSGFNQVAKGVYSISRHPGNGNDEASEKASLGPGDAARRVDKGSEHAPTIA